MKKISLLFSLIFVFLFLSVEPVAAATPYYLRSENSGYVNFGTSAFAFERTDSFSFEFWLKTSTESTTFLIPFAKSHPGNIGYFFSHESGYPTFVLLGANGTQVKVRWAVGLTLNTWYHWVITYNGSSTAAGLKFYQNGALISPTIVFNNLNASILNSSAPFYFYGYQGTNYGRCSLDEFRVWTRVLTLDEVLYLYNGGAGCSTINYDPDVLAQYHLDEGGGTAIYPAKGTYIGAIKNTLYWHEGGTVADCITPIFETDTYADFFSVCVAIVLAIILTLCLRDWILSLIYLMRPD